MSKAQPHQYNLFQKVVDADEIDLGKTLATLIDGRWVILSIAALSAIAGLLYVLFATPIYKADALLQVEEKTSALADFANMADMLAQDASAITEIEVLKSRMVIGKAVDEYKLDIIASPHYLPVIGRGLIRLFDFNELGLMVSLFSNYAWGGEVINISRLVVPDILLGIPLTLVAGEQGNYQLFDHDKLLLSGRVGELAEGSDIQLLVTDMVARSGVEFSISRNARLDVIQNLQKKLSVTEKGRRSGVLVVSLEGEDREETRKILDSISKHYLMQNVRRLSAEAEKGLEFLNAHLPNIKEKLTASEQMLSSFRLKNRSVDLTMETRAILEQIVNLDAQLNELTFKEAELRKSFTREHPSYIALASKRETLNKQKRELEEHVKSLPKTQQEILRHTRDVEVNQGIYLQLLNKVNELNVMKAGTVGNVRILDYAETLSKPVKPRQALIIIIVTILGFMVGVGIVFLREALRRGVKSTDEIEAIGLPVYATIPYSDLQQKLNRKLNDRKSRASNSESSLLAATSGNDLSIEAIRSLRTSMHFARINSEDKVLMITGPNQDIGKSFVSANLAAVYAQMGQKVLQIDADMRKGHMQDLFNLEKRNGLSEYLSGQIKIDKIIKRTEVENLHFISCGETPPNPSELLMLPGFDDLVEWAKKTYDLIIIDTPPVLAVTDAAVIGRFASIIMLVAWFDVTSVKEIEATMRRCEQNGIKIRGCILNGIVKKAGYYDFGQYGYYGYSYNNK